MNNSEKLQALETYFDLMTMNGAVQVFHIANQFKIFHAMAEQHLTPTTIAEYCGVQETPVTLLLEVLQSLHLLENLLSYWKKEDIMMESL